MLSSALPKSKQPFHGDDLTIRIRPATRNQTDSRRIRRADNCSSSAKTITRQAADENDQSNLQKPAPTDRLSQAFLESHHAEPQYNCAADRQTDDGGEQVEKARASKNDSTQDFDEIPHRDREGRQVNWHRHFASGKHESR